MTDDEIAKLVDAEFEDAMGAEEIAQERAKAWRYFMRELRGDEEEGESQVVTSEVSDVVDGIMPSLLRIFTTAENLVSFDPVSEEDIPAAEQESDHVNYVFFKQNPAFMIMYTWMFDALVQKNGYTKAWWTEQKVATTEQYKGLTDDELALLMDDDELEAVEQEEAEETIPGPGGQTVTLKVHNVKFTRTTKRGHAKVENVPPEEFRISKDAKMLDPSTARLVGHERIVTRGYLLELGFPKELVESLPAHGAEEVKPEKEARENKSDEQGGNAVTTDKSQDPIMLREGYIKVDDDGDGTAELKQVFTASGKFLSKEDEDRQPFHAISPHPLPHKHTGQATSEKVMDLQDIGTTLVRQSLTNLYHVNKPGHAVWEQGIGENTLDDLLTVRIGGIKRFARPVGESYSPMTVPFTAGASLQALEYFDKVKRNRTGIGSDSEGLSPEALKNIQQSVLMSATDISKMKIEAIARIFAETGFKSLFMHIHELTRKNQDKATVVRLRNKFVPVDPREWRTRFDMTVNIGLGIGTREQNLVHLEAIWNKQKEMAAAGWTGLTVTPQNIYRTAAEFVKNANLKDPGMFFTDPGNKQAPAPPSEAMRLQQMEQELEKRRQMLDQQKQELATQRAALEREQAVAEHHREVGELKRKTEADADRHMEEMEKLRNELTELELRYNRNVPGAGV